MSERSLGAIRAPRGLIVKLPIQGSGRPLRLDTPRPGAELGGPTRRCFDQPHLAPIPPIETNQRKAGRDMGAYLEARSTDRRYDFPPQRTTF